jgi:hypothetical protein
MPREHTPLPTMSPLPGSPGRLAVLTLLARHPHGLHENEMLIGVQVQVGEPVDLTYLRELLRALRQPRGSEGHPRPGLLAREGRQGRWYSPQAREAADIRAGRRLDHTQGAVRARAA